MIGTTDRDSVTDEALESAHTNDIASMRPNAFTTANY